MSNKIKGLKAQIPKNINIPDDCSKLEQLFKDWEIEERDNFWGVSRSFWGVSPAYGNSVTIPIYKPSYSIIIIKGFTNE